MDAGLIAMRMRLSGGSQVASEAAVADAAVNKTGSEFTTAGKKAERASTGIRRSLSKQIAGMKSIGRGMTYGVTLPLAGAAFMAIKTAATFDRTMAQVQIATKLGGSGIAEMRDLAMEMGAKTIFSANDAAEAMLELSKAGITAAQIKAGALAATMSLAAAGGQDLATSAVQVGSAMNTFNIKADKSRMIADALAGGANQSSASLSDLALALQQAGQQAVASGLNLHETVGILAAFADQGIRGSDAGTSLKVFLQRLNPVTKKAREEMNRLGIDFFDANGRMKDMRGIAVELQQGLHGMTQKERLAAMQILFGTDAMRAANIVYNLHGQELDKYIKATEEKGAADKMAQAQMKGLPGAIEKLKGSLETAALSAGHAATPAIIVLAGALEGLANGFTALPSGTQTAIVAFAGVIAIAGPLIWALGSIAAAYQKLGLAGTGMAGKVGKGALIGGLGMTAAQLAGGAVGGDAGSAISNIGSGAAIGFGVGGPWGAAAGAGAGALLTWGDDLMALFETEKKIDPLQQKLASSSRSMAAAYRAARDQVRVLRASEDAVERTQRRHRDATRRVERAQDALNAARRRSGPNSQAAIQAEVRYSRAIRGVTAARKAQQRAERQHGQELQTTKELLRFATLEERHRINVLRASRRELNARRRAMKADGASLQELQPINEKLGKNSDQLRKAQKRQAETMLEAAKVVGGKYATFLRNGGRASLEYGGKVNATKEKLRTMRTALDEVVRAIQRTDDAFEAGVLGQKGNVLREGIERTEDDLGNLNGRSSGAGDGGRGGGKGAPGKSGRRNTGAEPTAGSSALRLMLERGGKRGPRTVYKQPVVIALDSKGRRRLAEGVIDVQDDEDARR